MERCVTKDKEALRVSWVEAAGSFEDAVPGTEDSPMATLTVPEVPDGLYRKIKALARYRHRGFGPEVIRLLTIAMHVDAPPGNLVAAGNGTRTAGPVEHYKALLGRGRGCRVIALDRALLLAAARVRSGAASTEAPGQAGFRQRARERRILRLADHPRPR
jgi:hypothetical protein